jgi:hypothetical protein
MYFDFILNNFRRWFFAPQIFCITGWPTAAVPAVMQCTRCFTACIVAWGCYAYVNWHNPIFPATSYFRAHSYSHIYFFQLLKIELQTFF